MQIKLDMKILIFLLIFYITHQIKIYILLMIFACLHELGHLFLGLALGMKPLCFEIKPIGFSISLKNKVEDYNKKILNGNLLELKKIFVYLIGPVVNIICASMIFYFNIDVLLKQELIYINLIIAFVNFLPIYPLDGGRIFKSLVCIFCGLRRAYALTEKVSFIVMGMVLAVGSMLILKVQNFGLLIMIFYLAYVKIIETRKIRNKLRLYKLMEKKQQD